jgi:large subunit ribosomal protein L13
MKTTTLPLSAPDWRVLDAAGRTIGEVAANAAYALRGKHKASFSPHQLCGDHVVVLNVAKLSIPASKERRKVYYKHTGFTGHMKKATLGQKLTKDATWVVREAILGMLPKNSLRPRMLKRLHLFTGDEHPYAARKPEPLPYTVA